MLHCGLAIYIKKYLKAKEEIWKLKWFTTLAFFFGGRILATWQPKKKKAGESNKGIFELKKTIRHILTKKTYTVCSCRSPELGRTPKKIY